MSKAQMFNQAHAFAKSDRLEDNSKSYGYYFRLRLLEAYANERAKVMNVHGFQVIEPKRLWA